MKTAAELQAQRETDGEILFYTREMQGMAPVTLESIHGFLTVQRRRRLTERNVQDRLDYLASSGQLEQTREWQGGELIHYRVTAYGMDVMDGNVPPPNWK